MGCISDSFNRPIDYLRVSVTDRCNLRCVYCMPAGGVALMPREDVLRYEEITQIVRAAAALGVSKVRLTGGEPLVRAGIVDLVGMIAAVRGVDDLALTTNGAALSLFAAPLRAAGLRRVNVSLDTLRPERFRRITRYGELEPVLAGIEAARESGLEPVKVNMVVMRGVNDDEVLDFARLTVDRAWHVRFIEFMPFGERAEEMSVELGSGGQFISAVEIKEELKALGQLEAVRAVPGNGPARYYRRPGSAGSIGFISPVSEHFCFQCNRLRLTADGRLRPCLLDDREIDLRGALRAGGHLEDLQRMIAEAVMAKPARHQLAKDIRPRARAMGQIGG